MTIKTLPSQGKRSSGLLMHPTSLPSSAYVGDIGPAARAFADSLRDAGQKWWQMLPICPTGMGNSPYAGLSAFAGNPLLVSLDDMVEDGYLSKQDLPTLSSVSEGRVDFEEAQCLKYTALRKAYNRFHPTKAFLDFCANEDAWLAPYAMFIGLKTQNENRSWLEWKDKNSTGPIFENEMRFHKFIQFIFFKQWSRLRVYCGKKKIGLIGDMPIYVAHDSSDVWSNPQLFYLKPDGHASFVAGTPPRLFQ